MLFKFGLWQISLKELYDFEKSSNNERKDCAENKLM